MKKITLFLISVSLIGLAQLGVAAASIGEHADNQFARVLGAQIITPASPAAKSKSSATNDAAPSTKLEPGINALLISGMDAAAVKASPLVREAKKRGLPIVLINFNKEEMQAITGGFAVLGSASSNVALVRADVKGHYSDIEIFRPSKDGYVTDEWLEKTAQDVHQLIEKSPFSGNEKMAVKTSAEGGEVPIASACALYEKEYEESKEKGEEVGKPICYHWSASIKQGFDGPDNAYSLLTTNLLSSERDHYSGNQGQSISYSADYYLIDGTDAYGANKKYLIANIAGIGVSSGHSLQVNTAHHRGLFLYEASSEFSLKDSVKIDGKTYSSSPGILEHVHTERVAPKVENQIDEVKTKMGFKVGMDGKKPSIGLDYSEERTLTFEDFSVTHRRPDVHTDKFIYTLASTYDNIVNAKLLMHNRDMIIQCYAHTVWSGFPCDVNRLPKLATSSYLPEGEVIYRVDHKASGDLVVGSKMSMTLLAADGSGTSKYTNGRTAQFVTREYSAQTTVVINVNAVG